MIIPDAIELMEMRAERLMDKYVDEHTCMECGKKVDYDLICPDPMGMAPTVCFECLSPGQQKAYTEFFEETP